MKIVIIGGVAGGASAAARLRRLNEDAKIVMLEKGPYISFANCGLPYYLSRVIPAQDDLLLQTPESFFGRFCVDVRTLHEAICIDRKGKKVQVLNHKTGDVYEESYDKLVYSPGAVAVRPASIVGCNLPGVFTLRSVSDIVEIDCWLREMQVKEAVVAGGGFVGIEVAENLAKRGLKTTIVDFADHIIGSVDIEMAAIAQQEVRKHGVKLMIGCKISSIEQAENGLKVCTDQGDIPAGLVLMSVGIAPNNKLAKEAGLELGVRGSVVVNDRMQSSDPDIYAVGDVTEATEFVTSQKAHLVLAGPANRQGRIAADQIMGIDSRYKKTQGSCIMKVFDLAVASTGLTEKAAKAAGCDVDKIYLYGGSHAEYYPGAVKLASKILFERKTGKLLGAQFVGAEGADKRADVFATALRAGMNALDLVDLELCYTPAYNSAKDPLNMAGFAIENILTGRVKNAHWPEVESLEVDKVTLLDVRTEEEYREGHVPGFVNIPLHELRERIEEIPKDKPVYVHCLSGLRSYVACMMLKGHCYDPHNISGGWFMYQMWQSLNNR